ncbi:baseplate multidomain protein megatron [Roseibium alexandrii]|uniref:Tail protein n=1 Tax=Roseibium alexandrii (strain DSM 17067 / NCIMB 14079 / DFL-11) TaxID=244592 RepID=A0A5E8GUZ3_ROSAD|nr:glycoside hydrolase/phage tail family protein [Roseibium alexandrii]EEE43055.2 hypothetical protein SADFL11_341 [Roseibium alexandrii DFL-11]
MATLLLGAAASALVGATGATGLVASAITTAVTIGGSLLDSYLFSGGGSSQTVEGARLDSLQVLSSTEGAAIPIVAGFARVSGQVIWATNLEEEIQTSTQRTGGKGGGGGSKVTTTTYAYFGNFAVGLCEGPIAAVLRVWADGNELDLTQITHRIYTGSEDQLPDSLIEAKQGAGNAPAYRGLAYVVFDRLPLEKFGNRIPQLTFEVMRSVGREEELLTGMCIIPGSTEFGYEPQRVADFITTTDKVDNNRHTKTHTSDWLHSLDLLKAVCPNVDRIALVVAWFGTDLRCDQCLVEPRIEAVKQTDPIEWQVAGLSRETATVVSYIDGKPAYGGSPNDASVIAAIKDLKARGFKVLLYPFIMMDIENDNGFPDPYGRPQQPPYPWRGRITCHPAPGQPGTPDKTAAAATQAAVFIGTAQPGHFGGSGSEVTYSGPQEWSYRRFILHLAKLAQMAGGVDAYCVGTEMPGMTFVRGAGNSFPFVSALVSLLSDVRSMLGASTKLGYAADWSEYHSYRPNDASGDVFFQLDPVWSSSDCDFIGIDNYMPLSDWRDGFGHADHMAGYQSIYDVAYLKANIEGGEYYDWFYASPEDRDSQTRTPIEDTAHGDHWVFRQKDVRNWWQNPHQNRPGGVRDTSVTGWVPQSKPVWFTELGCPGIDKGPNQPNVFYDPKSSESFVPYYSSGARDDFVQRRYLRAMLEFWADPGNNPVSPVYGGPMLEPGRLYGWAWDIRPFPSFPIAADVWADHANFYTGHWLSRRMGGAPADGIAKLMMERSGLVEGADFNTDGMIGTADGYIIDTITSARSVIESLAAAMAFDPVESGGRIEGRSRRHLKPVADLDPADMLDRGKNQAPVTIRRAQETDLPRAVRVTAYDAARDFQTVTGEALLEMVVSDRVVVTDTPMVADFPRMVALAEFLLQEAWASREGYQFGTSEADLALEPGDLVSFDFGGRSHLVRLTKAVDGLGRKIEGKSYDGPVYEPARNSIIELGRIGGGGGNGSGGSGGGGTGGGGGGRPDVTADVTPVFIDGPLLRDQDSAHQGYLTGIRKPFASGLVFLSSPTTSGYVVRASLAVPGRIGHLIADLAPGPLHRWDRRNAVELELYDGQLQGLDDLQVFAGGNAVLIEAPNGDWELVQFANAELTGARTYRLTRLLRGQKGTETAMGAVSGARVVFLDGGLEQTGLDRAQIGLPLNWQAGPASGAVGDPDFVGKTVTFTGRGERPLSPVHLKPSDAGGGDIALSWIRRTRIGGDGWEQADVPLGEDLEAYEIEIWKDGSLKRTLQSTSQSVTYTAAQQAADFGSSGQSFEFRVFQMSATYGRGAAGKGSYQV